MDVHRSCNFDKTRGQQPQKLTLHVTCPAFCSREWELGLKPTNTNIYIIEDSIQHIMFALKCMGEEFPYSTFKVHKIHTTNINLTRPRYLHLDSFFLSLTSFHPY